MIKLYPFQFKTIYKEKIWGGNKIKDLLNKNVSGDIKYGEAWELSAVEGNISVVINGPLAGKNLKELSSTYTTELLGKSCFKKYGAEFPILVKYLDANADLSVQVHPDDAYAQENYGHNSYGKAEMWYVMQADEDAELILGFNKDLTRDEFLESVKSASIEELVNKEKVVRGDVFFVPPGRIHNIGKGIMIAEIQQTSDLTYRIYDFDRLDTDGAKRELHLENAADVLNYSKPTELRTIYDHESQLASLVSNEFFTINKHHVSKGEKSIDLSSLDSFVILIGVDGTGKFNSDGYDFNLNMGEVVLLPATTNSLNIKTFNNLEYLEVYIK